MTLSEKNRSLRVWGKFAQSFCTALKQLWVFEWFKRAFVGVAVCLPKCLVLNYKGQFLNATIQTIFLLGSNLILKASWHILWPVFIGDTSLICGETFFCERVNE